MLEPELENYREQMSKQRPPFQEVLNALLDETHPFPPRFLHLFSDIDPAGLEKLTQIWDQVTLTRRRSLMEDLEEINDTDTLVSFSDLARFALSDSDPLVRGGAIRLLWEDDDKSLAPIFLSFLESDQDVTVRAIAANALGNFVYLGEMEEIPENLHQQVEEALLAVVTSDELPLIRRRALESLGFSSRPEVPGLLEEAYDLATPDWLASALFAMGRSADRRWQGRVLDMLEHSQPAVRLEAARAAGELELKLAREALMIMAREDEDDSVILAAIWSLSQIGGEGIRDLMEEILDSTEDEDVAFLIEDALENLSFTEDTEVFGLLEYTEDDLKSLEEVEDEEALRKRQSSKKKGKGD